MEEMDIQERPGIFSRFAGMFIKDVEDDIEEMDIVSESPRVHVRQSTRFNVTVRRQVLSFQDAVAAADGLKRGELQVLNLNHVDDKVKDKIKDFMCGVNYAQEGTWEEVGDNLYLLAPTFVMVEVAPASPRMQAARN